MDTPAVPPNNKALETDLFLYVRDAAAVVKDLGFLGPGTLKASFPGLGAALAAAGSMAQGGCDSEGPKQCDIESHCRRQPDGRAVVNVPLIQIRLPDVLNCTAT